MKSILCLGPRSSRRHRALFAPLLCLALLLFAGCPPIVRPPPAPGVLIYRVVDLGASAPNGDSEAFSINNASEVVGWVRVNSQKQATAWTNITTQPLARALWTKAGDNSIAYAINNASNQSSGWAGGGLGAGLPYWFPSTRLWIPNVEGRAYALADTGVTVGWSYLAVGASNQKAVLFNGGHPIVPGAPVNGPFELGNFGTDNSRAYGVNRALHIVGAAATASGPSHAFHHVGISKLQPTDDLGTLGGPNSEACSINTPAQVAGWSDVKMCPTTVRHAFLWDKSKMQDLGTPYPTLPVTLKDPGGVPRAVWWVSTLVRSLDGDGGHCITDRQNAEGQPQVVGYSILYYPFAPPKPYDPLCVSPEPATFHRAWMWDGKMHDLNDMIPPNSGWYLLEAWGINDKGQIVGRGMHNGQIRAYALLP